LNSSIWAEIEAARKKDVATFRLVSVYDFESENGYEIDADKGKPLSAYKFAEENKANGELPIRKFLEHIVSDNYPKNWTQDEIEEIEEPQDG